MRQRDANLTALAAIGPRKKRKVDSPGPGSGTEVQQSVGTRVGGTVGPQTLSGERVSSRAQLPPSTRACSLHEHHVS